MAQLPVIVGFGGINPAGRSSFHHGYRRLVIDTLNDSEADKTLQSLAALMGLPPGQPLSAEQKRHVLEHTLIRQIEPEWFDTEQVVFNKRMPCSANGSPLTFVSRARDLPETIPPQWRVSQLEEGRVRVEIEGDTEFLVPTTRAMSVRAAGMLPSGFDPGKLYQSRNHPRGLQMSVYAASDAIQSLGIPWQQICDRVHPDQISVYAGSAMAQLDDQSYAGLLSARGMGRRITSKQVPLGLAEMPADFVNAYVLGNVGSTGLGMGACATFLYNLRMGIQDIRSGSARVAIIGSSEAPVTPDVIDGYAAMGALATDQELLQLDASAAATTPNYRRACRPFSSNCGFTVAEAAQFVVLFDDALALELGASIYGAVPDVFVNADGYKKSISSPGIGNYLTVTKAMAAARAIVGEAGARRSFVQAHGTGTPQNRVTESHILNETAKLFGIEKWPVAAIKSYLGHTIAAASGDQLVASLGVWAHGVIPGIHSIDHIADDVHASHLQLQSAHMEVDASELDVAILNAKGFGGNNASATVLAPHVVTGMLQGRHGSKAWAAYQQRNEAVRKTAAAYDERASRGDSQVVYRFGEGVLEGEDLGLGPQAVTVPGFSRSVDLALTSPFADWDKT